MEFHEFVGNLASIFHKWTVLCLSAYIGWLVYVFVQELQRCNESSAQPSEDGDATKVEPANEELMQSTEAEIVIPLKTPEVPVPELTEGSPVNPEVTESCQVPVTEEESVAQIVPDPIIEAETVEVFPLEPEPVPTQAEVEVDPVESTVPAAGEQPEMIDATLPEVIEPVLEVGEPTLPVSIDATIPAETEASEPNFPVVEIETSVPTFEFVRSVTVLDGDIAVVPEESKAAEVEQHEPLAEPSGSHFVEHNVPVPELPVACAVPEAAEQFTEPTVPVDSVKSGSSPLPELSDAAPVDGDLPSVPVSEDEPSQSVESAPVIPEADVPVIESQWEPVEGSIVAASTESTEPVVPVTEGNLTEPSAPAIETEPFEPTVPAVEVNTNVPVTPVPIVDDEILESADPVTKVELSEPCVPDIETDPCEFCVPSIDIPQVESH